MCKNKNFPKCPVLFKGRARFFRYTEKSNELPARGSRGPAQAGAGLLAAASPEDSPPSTLSGEVARSPCV